MLYLDSLPLDTLAIFQLLAKSDFISSFYLSGGTGLSLQLNHRQSQDLDFFCQNDFDPEKILIKLKDLGHCHQVRIDKGTLNLYLEKVKVQFLYYPYDLLDKFISYENIHLSSILDIACTKLITISSRGSKKDFVDLYFLLQIYSLKQLFQNLDQKYKNLDYNQIHILKSLTFFEDAEHQPEPKMIKSASWTEIKKTISQKIKSFQLDK